MAFRGVRRVVIVGGGIAGPVLGVALRTLGIEVVIAEQRAAAALGDGAFLGVAPNGMNALAELSLAEAVAARGFACEAFRFSNRSGKTVGSIDRSHDAQAFGWPLTMIRRAELHAVLADEARARDVDLVFGKRLESLDRSSPNHVVARFTDGSTISGDIVVGCDGLRSRVRALAVPDAPEPTFSGLLDFGGFVAGVEVPFGPGVNEMVFGRKAFLGAFRTLSGETWWFHNGPPADAASPRDPLDPAAARQRLVDLHRDDPHWIGDLIRATPKILGPWPIHDLVAMPRWSEGRVCLLGDAAHAMSPSAGQGASLAMEDALVLAQCLRDIEDPSTAFETFERLRRPRVDAMFRHAARNGSGKAMNSGASEWLRDRLLPFFLRLGASAQSKAYAHRIDWDRAVA